MPDQLQLRGGTTTEHNSFTGAIREVTVDTTKKTLVVHDGASAGGTPLMRESGGTAATTVQIGTGGVERFKITNGEVVFNETSTDTDFRIEGNGNANLFKVDAGNDRIGIGTSSPTAPMHIVGSGNTTVLKVESTDDDANVGPIIELFRNSASPADNDQLGRIDFRADDASGGDSTFARIAVTAIDVTNNTEDARIDFTAVTNDTFTPTMSITGQNVGIGTTSPSRKLHVASSFIRVDDGFGLDSSGSTERVTLDNGFISLRVASAERMRIDSGGRLLLGTSSARSSGGGVNAHLQLEGTTSQSAEFLITRNTADTFSPTLGLVKTRGTSVGSNTAVQDNDVLGTIQFRGADGSDIFSVGASIFARVNGTPSDGTDMPAELVFATTADGASSPSERMSIDSSGNVGIGTTSPSQKLDVNGNGLIQGTLQVNDRVQLVDSTPELLLSVPSGGLDSRILNDGSGNLIIGHGTNSDSPTERMRIDSVGTVLVAHSSARNNFFGTASSEHIPIVQLEGTSQRKILSLTSSNTSDGGTLILARQNGNPGSNTVVSSGNQIGRIDFQGNDGTNMETAAIISAEIDGTPGNDDMPGRLLFKTTADGAKAATERMRINSSGNLTIGTTNPDSGGSAIGNDFGFVYLPSGHAIVRSASSSVSGASGICYTAKFADTGTGKAFRVMLAQTEIGSIGMGAGGTSFNTSSDYRRKENIVNLTGAITRLKTLLPKRFNFKDEPSVTRDGFLAHEVTTVPEAVTGIKDEVDSNNNPVYQQLDQSKLVPLLVAAVQELISKVEALEAA